MKKRLLITSIVMMLVVAVALGTSTYAWFTSSNSVTADSITMNAAVNSAAALEISYVDTEGNWLTVIEAVSPTPQGGFNPAAPSVMALPNSGTSTPGTYYSAITWATSDVINGKFKANGTGSQQYVWHDTDGEGKHESFFLHNGSTANVITGVTMSATITGAAAPFIRVAVFKNDGSGNFELLGIISNLENYAKATAFASETDYYYYDSTLETPAFVKDTEVTAENWAAKVTARGMLYTKDENYANVTVGAITEGKAVTAMTTPGLCTETVALGGLAVNNNAPGGSDEMELKVAVWMDGSALNDDTAGSTGKTAQISLSFEASRA